MGCDIHMCFGFAFASRGSWSAGKVVCYSRSCFLMAVFFWDEQHSSSANWHSLSITFCSLCAVFESLCSELLSKGEWQIAFAGLKHKECCYPGWLYVWFPQDPSFFRNILLKFILSDNGPRSRKKKKGFPCRNNKLFHDQDFHGFAPQSASFLVFTLCVMSNKKETKLDFFLKKTWNVLSVKDDVLLNLTFPMKNSLNEKFAASLNK